MLLPLGPGPFKIAEIQTETARGGNAVNIFISWSGAQSMAVAASLRKWLKLMIQASEPWMSSSDILTGQRWQTAISEKLSSSNFGILCVTSTNLSSPWLLFEAGALSKALGAARVCPYLSCVDDSQLPEPLTQFQASMANKEGTLRLILSINQTLGPKALSEIEIRDLFETLWPKLELELAAIEQMAEQRTNSNTPTGPSGIEFAAPSRLDFRTQDGRRDYGDFVRGLILESGENEEVKLIGIDCVEIFGGSISGITELYRPIMTNHGVRFRVVLLDPRTKSAFEKRSWEGQFRGADGRKYTNDHPDRIYDKILDSCRILEGYRRDYFNQLSYKFVDQFPAVCCLLVGDRAVFYWYSKCHKGWDSPVFCASRTQGGILVFLEEYFEFMWENPAPTLPPGWQATLKAYRMKLQRIQGQK